MSHTSKPRVNWHEAASCAFQIELKNYSHILEYISEYPLGKNSYRIDLLVIKKLTDERIPKNIARIFKTLNLLEIKGIGSSINIDSYYKTIGYAGLLIAQMGKSDSSSRGYQYSSLDISLTLLSCHYPRKLMNHLKQERKLHVAKISNGVYYINKETFHVQIIVTKELSYEDNLYLY
ncbi:MAG: 3-isopropylmalate dehydrogenase, partial [Lachnospiraceae bacterium]|nr:3-isopropylmalate dehydrogenase [Lachnospiraceae bacterium]